MEKIEKLLRSQLKPNTVLHPDDIEDAKGHFDGQEPTVEDIREFLKSIFHTNNLIQL